MNSRNYIAVIRVAIKTDGEETSSAEAELSPEHNLILDGSRIAHAATSLFYQVVPELKNEL